MRKTIIGFLTFCFTLLIGLSVYNAWYPPAHNSVQEVPLTVVNNSVESVQNKAENEYAAVESYKIASCINPNSFKHIASRKIPTIKGGVVNQWVICGTLPEYPETALDRNISGEVFVNVLIDESGEFAEASIKSGHPLFHQAALKAVHQTRTAPILLGGEFMKARGVLVYQFDSERGVSFLRRFSIKNSVR
ncbi:MAG: TonB family protein [Acidobacteria bacterium]|jgi:TonB family protein|nr:TonB family protein [Acidobacteriota bacterium]